MAAKDTSFDLGPVHFDPETVNVLRGF